VPQRLLDELDELIHPAAFLVEIFPFHIRAKGMSVFQWWSRAALFFNQFVNPIGIANIGWKFYIRSANINNIGISLLADRISQLLRLPRV
jgi:hypothetical protein